MRALAVLLLAACGESSAPQPSRVEPASVATVAADAATPSPRRAFELPGTVWWLEDAHPLPTLACASRDGEARLEGAGVFPSSAVLPDGRVVAIASTGDGRPEGEQLALVTCGKDRIVVERVGMKATQVREPAVDPRGRWIVVAANVEGHSELYRVDLPAGTHARLTTHRAGNFHPSALPGTDDIVFVSSRDGDSELYRMAVRGGAAKRLTAFHADDWHPVPSPDGKLLAFLSDREGRPRIFLVKPDGTQIRRLTRRDDATYDELEPVWSPDGTRLAYVVQRGAASRVVIHDLATGIEHERTPHGASDVEPQWSPDGAWLVTARTRDGRVDLWATSTAATSTQTMRITQSAASERVPRWIAPRSRPD